MAHTTDNFKNGIKALLSTFIATINFKIHTNKMAGNQGRAAAIRELTLQMDTIAFNRASWILSIWDTISDDSKFSTYNQVIRYVTQMQRSEEIAIEKLNEFITSNGLSEKDIPPFILLALNTHKRLVMMSTGLKSMIEYLEENKPEELAKISIEDTYNPLLEPSLNSRRDVLIAKL